MTVANHINVNGKRVAILKETIFYTWLTFAENAQGCIDEVLSGKVKVNDQESYIKEKQALVMQYAQNAEDVLIPSGLELWFWQKAYFIQSGQSVGILS